MGQDDKQAAAFQGRRHSWTGGGPQVVMQQQLQQQQPRPSFGRRVSLTTVKEGELVSPFEGGVERSSASVSTSSPVSPKGITSPKAGRMAMWSQKRNSSSGIVESAIKKPEQSEQCPNPNAVQRRPSGDFAGVLAGAASLVAVYGASTLL